MEIHLVKREMMLNGNKDISFVPSFPIDIKRSEKIPLNKPFAVETKVKRDVTANSKLWALCSYFVANLPERYFYTDESGDSIPSISSSRQLYEILKLRVGFVKVYELDGVTYKVPLESNWGALKDELEYQEKFHQPAIKELAIMADMQVYDLFLASQEWRANK